MRHQVKRISLGKDRKHRISILRNLAVAFIRHERVTTTKSKARIFRSFIEKIITRSKVDNLHNRRIVHKDIKSTSALKKMFENVAKRYVNRPGGYTRTYKLIQRSGDASEMCVIELVPEFLDSDKDNEETKSEDLKLQKTEKSGEKKEKKSFNQIKQQKKKIKAK